MDMALKVCPHCKAQLRQLDGAYELVKKGMAASEHAPGRPVTLYSCPNCGYIELYDLRVSGRL